MDILAPPSVADIQAAAARIAPHVHRTPVFTCAALDRCAGATLAFKAEPLQKVGAFKARGAVNAVFSLSDAEAACGVATHSSGNHAAALAYAARRRGIAAHVVMPRTAPPVKRAAVEGYGATVTPCDPGTQARETALAALVAGSGATVVHPFNDARVIAGQGTCALELLEQAGPFDAVIAPVGGGGLLSGTAITCAALSPGVRVFGAEPRAADDAARSLRAGRLIAEDGPATIADGLRTSLKDLTFGILSTHVADILTVTETQIVEAMRTVWQRMKLVIEPSSAVAVAAVLSHPAVFQDMRVGIILTGGNVDLDALPWTAAAGGVGA